jgi:hypothetical protein
MGLNSVERFKLGSNDMGKFTNENYIYEEVKSMLHICYNSVQNLPVSCLKT